MSQVLPPGHTRRLRPDWAGGRRTTEWRPVPGPINTVDGGHLIVRLDHEEAKPPTLAYDGDAGLDLVTSEATRIPVGQFRDVPCGVSLQLPVGHWGLIKGRSSTLRRRGLLVNDAVIDNGYTGPIYVGVWNLGEVAAEVQPGERIAQLVLCEIARVPVTVVDSDAELVSRDGRSGGGFGSTGS